MRVKITPKPIEQPYAGMKISWVWDYGQHKSGGSGVITAITKHVVEQYPNRHYIIVNGKPVVSLEIWDNCVRAGSIKIINN